MAERIYKGRFGWSAEDESHQATHVLLTVVEYEKLRGEIRDAKRDKEDAKKSAELEIARINTLAQRQIRDVQDDTAAQVADLQEQLDDATAEVNYQKKLNENLLRISRERANADRGLRPKKEHSGYAVISTREIDMRYDKGRKIVKVWETVIQSPYGVKIPEEQARKQIFCELLDVAGGWKLGDIGIKRRYMQGIDALAELDKGNIKSQNTAFEGHLRLNLTAGYWEYYVRHTLPLGVVPEDMLPG